MTTLLAATALTFALVRLGGDTLPRCRRVLGFDHPTTLAAAAALTGALAQLVPAERARALGQETLQRSRRILGPNHPITLYLTQVAGIGRPLLGSDAAEVDPSPPQ